MSEGKNFFAQQSEQSQIKAKIVKSYFDAWSAIMVRHWKDSNLGYIDLFSGPGVYEDGAESVPLMLVKKTLSNASLCTRMRFIFNDVDENNIKNLQSHIEELHNSSSIISRIRFMSEEITTNFSERIRIPPNMPILSFVDPWGYKGLTMDLINKLIQNNGSDCIFFFNYNRINMALSNTYFDTHLEGLFGKYAVAGLKHKLSKKKPQDREILIIQELANVLRANRSNYVLPFKFYSQEMMRTSHFIIFVTKHVAGYKIMKEIMYANSAKDADGIATFSYEDSNNFGDQGMQLSFFQRPFEQLCSQLREKYAGQKVSIKKICNDFSLDTSTYFVAPNVKDALRRLEEQGRIEIEGRKQMMRDGKATMPDGAFAIFL